MTNEESLERLQAMLAKDFSWPSVYMFKLIIPAENRTFALVQKLFPDEARFFTRNSKSGKYIIITVKELMLSPEEVISRYRNVLEIEGVIIL
jgi:uncharacterized protein